MSDHKAFDTARPLQIVHSFEGLINGTDGAEVMISYGRPRTAPDITDFAGRVRRELEQLRARGIGGVAVNVGYERYLEDEAGWQRFILGCRTAAELGLRLWIYDENGYPSGTAGGIVLRGHPELEAVGIKKLSVAEPAPGARIGLPEPRARLYAAFRLTAAGVREPVPVERNGTAVVVPPGAHQALEVFFIAPLYDHSHAARNAGSSRRYINLLAPAATARFLKVTHVQYAQRLPADLRAHVEAVFTDEPSFMSHVAALPWSRFEEDPVNWDPPLFPSVPWCEELDARILAEQGFALERCVWMLFAGDGRTERKVRRAFRQSLTELYDSAYARQTADVCAALGLDFSGHLLWEETLYQHTVMQGSTLKILQRFHRPGIDVLTGNPELFLKTFILTHKVALSASFFGTGRGLMTETSDYSEYWHGDKKGASVAEIKHVLAMQYLMGVRDFCFYFVWRRFTPEQYREICDFTARLNATGAGGGYQPECALYYPIELCWESYLPTIRAVNGPDLAAQSRRFRRIDRAVTAASRSLFFANVQYVLAGREELGRLRDRGVTRLVYPEVGRPEPSLPRLCREAGVELIALADIARLPARTDLTAGPSVALGRYRDFTMAVNCSRNESFLDAAGQVGAVFPARGTAREPRAGRIVLSPLESVFLFTE